MFIATEDLKVARGQFLVALDNRRSAAARRPVLRHAQRAQRHLRSQQRDVAEQGSTHVDSALLKPEVEFVGVEPQKVSPLQEWDATLGDQPANVANGNAEMLRDLLDRDEGR